MLRFLSILAITIIQCGWTLGYDHLIKSSLSSPTRRTENYFNNMETKQCTKCKEIKPVDLFRRWNRHPSGRMSACKDCMKPLDKRFNDSRPRHPRPSLIISVNGTDCKKCSKCGDIIELDKFGKGYDTAIGLSSACKQCISIDNRRDLPEIELIEGEIWKPVIGHLGRYEVSNFGRVKALGGVGLNCYSDKILSTSKHKIILKSGEVVIYHIIVLSYNGERINTSEHRLAAEAFIPNPNNLPHVNHKDSNPSNNHIDNLEWITPKGNVWHAINAGRRPRFQPQDNSGENNGHSRITNNDARTIRLLAESGLRQSILCKYYGLNSSVICNIVNNKTYKSCQV